MVRVGIENYCHHGLPQANLRALYTSQLDGFVQFKELFDQFSYVLTDITVPSL